MHGTVQYVESSSKATAADIAVVATENTFTKKKNFAIALMTAYLTEVTASRCQVLILFFSHCLNISNSLAYTAELVLQILMPCQGLCWGLRTCRRVANLTTAPAW